MYLHVYGLMMDWESDQLFFVHDGSYTYYDTYWAINRLSYLYVYGLMMDYVFYLTISSVLPHSNIT